MKNLLILFLIEHQELYLQQKSCNCLSRKTTFGSSWVNPGAVILRIFIVVFLLFLTLAGALTLQGKFYKHAGQSLTIN